MNSNQWTKLEDIGEQIEEMIEFLDEITDSRIAEIKEKLRESKNLIDESLESM